MSRINWSKSEFYSPQENRRLCSDHSVVDACLCPITNLISITANALLDRTEVRGEDEE